MRRRQRRLRHGPLGRARRFDRERRVTLPERARLAELVERLHDHGKLVLVEGIESAAHERLAVATGADLALGFRYSRPLTEQHFAEYLDA